MTGTSSPEMDELTRECSPGLSDVPGRQNHLEPSRAAQKPRSHSDPVFKILSRRYIFLDKFYLLPILVTFQALCVVVMDEAMAASCGHKERPREPLRFWQISLNQWTCTQTCHYERK